MVNVWFQVTVAGLTTVGEGPNKKVARAEAAKNMLLLLDGVRQSPRPASVSHNDIAKFQSKSEYIIDLKNGQLQESIMR